MYVLLTVCCLLGKWGYAESAKTHSFSSNQLISLIRDKKNTFLSHLKSEITNWKIVFKPFGVHLAAVYRCKKMFDDFIVL